MSDLARTSKSAGLVRDHILFTGYVSDEILARLYGLCKVFVLPSLHEGFGLPAFEAMACGAPVLGSNCTSLPEVIGSEDALFDPYDEGSLSRKLAEVLASDTLRARLAAQVTRAG